MRQTLGVLVSVMVLALLTAGAAPALAATETVTESYINSWGNTVTTVSTYVDGVLTTRTTQEILPDGTVKLSKTWDYYANGYVKSYTEYRYSSIAPTIIHREFYDTGVMSFQDAQLYLNGELAVDSLSWYDANGYMVKSETRVLTTLADGTKVWDVTVNLYSGGTLLSSTVTQYPYGYNFNAPPAGEDPVDPATLRPGWGYGDPNHKHTGPNGKGVEKSHSRGPQAEKFDSSNQSSSNDPKAERPGRGLGDRNHNHTGNNK